MALFSERFQQLINERRPTGEVVAVDNFLVTVKGLTPVGQRALVLFENGVRGLVREVRQDSVLLMKLSRQHTPVGMIVVVENEQLVTGVGDALLGRVISANGKVLDGGPPPRISHTRPVFNDAPGIVARQQLDQQLPTGVTVVDTLFPVVLGQRIAVLGDSKSGKSTFALQMTQNQKNTDRIVVYNLISKRPADIDKVVNHLKQTGALEHTVVVATSVLDSLVESYLAPYIACAIGEHFWYNGRDAVVVYDDLTSHAQIYREISLIAGTSPGRDSYPGDMFYAHSSLLERAGRLGESGHSLTAVPVVLTPGDDMTAYLPTNVISITDGQIVFDLEQYRKGVRPAVNTGLSVSRVGGRGQSDRHKKLSSRVFQQLASYREAAEFSHFASELAVESQKNLVMGERILEIFNQGPKELYSLTAQQLMLEAITQTDTGTTVDLNGLKQAARDAQIPTHEEQDFQEYVQELLDSNIIQAVGGAEDDSQKAAAGKKTEEAGNEESR